MESATHDQSSSGPIDCETAVRRLWDFFDGRLPVMAREDVEAHLESCELCPPHFRFAGAMQSALATSSQALSTDDETQLRQRVRAALERVTSGRE